MPTFLSLIINITSPLNIKIIWDKNIGASNYQDSAGGNKFITMHNGIDKTDADNKSIGRESNRNFRKEL